MYKAIMMALGTAGLLLMFGNCNGGEKGTGVVTDGGHGIGIDTATVKRLDMQLAIDSIEADTIANDTPAPNDKKHNTWYIIQRVKTFYTLRDDQQCCSQNYLKLRQLTEKLCKEKGTNIKELLEDNHWTLEYGGGDPGEGWSFEPLSVDNVTMHGAGALVEVGADFKSTMKLQLVFERDDWYVDNFDMVSQTGFDATVEVYEEHEVSYNERELMIDYLRSAYEE